MPRKAAQPAAESVTADTAADAVPSESSTRRSSRIASQVAANPAPPAAPKPKRGGGGGRKRAAAEVSGNEEASGEKDAAGSAEKDPNAMDVDAPDADKPEQDGSGTKKRAKKAPAKAEEEDSPSLPEINIGDPLPTLTLKNEKDEDIQVADLVDEEHGVVLFLVPKADTPGCTTQACGFRDSHADFSGVNYHVYCLSADAPTAQAKWQTKKSLPYPLISDPKRTLISALGAGEGGKTKRSHFVFGPKKDGGKLLDKKIPVKPADSPKLALEFIKSL